MSASLYVYYKAPATAEVAGRVRTMQEELAHRSGVRGRLMRRRDEPGTWMEVYEAVHTLEQFEALLEDAVSRHALRELLLPGERRHAERFVDA